MNDLDCQILDLERPAHRRPSSKVTAIIALGLTEARYYQLLVRLLGDPEALAADPVTVNRLRRMRRSRQPWSQAVA